MAGQSSFSAQIDDWARATEARMTAVFHKAAEKVAEEVIRRTVVDTGYLRASFQASGAQMPMIRADAKPASGHTYAYDAGPVNLVILNVPIGGKIYMGFVANYAGFVEYGTSKTPARGMVRLTSQNWNNIVQDAVREAKVAVSKNL